MISRRTGLSIALLPLLSRPALALDDKPLRLIVPFPAGGATDAGARIVGEVLARHLGRPVIVDNRAGAGGNIGAEYVATQAAADGHTLLLGTTGNLAVAPALYRQLRYKPLQDFTPLSLAWRSWNVLVVKAGAPYPSVAKLIAEAKAHPGALNYGSSGIGTAAHLAGEWFKQLSATNLTHVPYKGGQQVVQDLLAGLLDLSFEPIGSALPLIRAGRLKALAVTSSRRLDSLPDVPTLQESGLPNAIIEAWAMFVAPATVAPQVAEQLNQALRQVLLDPQIISKVNATGVQVEGSRLLDTRAFLEAETARWQQVVRDANIVAN